MTTLNLLLLVAAFGALSVGSWSIYWARGADEHHHTQWGRLVFTFTLLGLGSLGLIAALVRADALAPVGLLAGFLVVALLWETREHTVEPGRRY